MSRKKINRNKGRKSGAKRGILATFIGALFLSVMFLAPAVLALFAVGLAPSLVSWLADQNRLRSKRVATIFLFNTAGVVPYLATVWQGGRGFGAATAILGDIYTWFTMYGAAGAGMFTLTLAPQITAALHQMRNQNTLKKIERAQKKTDR